MTKEEIKNFLANTKVYVNGKSKQIQEKLFSLGYVWTSSKTNIANLDEPFLLISEKGEITYTASMITFMKNKNKEITAEQILSLEPTEEFRPFKDRNECWDEMLKHQPFGWLNYMSEYLHISVVTNDGVKIEDTSFNFKAAADCTFADGTPFGITE